MFTGLVQTTGTVAARTRGTAGRWTAPPLELAEGDSVAVNGVCLTATAVSRATASPPT